MCMPKPIEKLAVIDGETLQDMRLQPSKFIIDTLLPQGISMLEIGRASCRERVLRLV